MKKSTLWLLVMLVVSVGTSGCAFQMQPVDVDTLKVTPPQMMVAHKVQLPLVLVLDPEQVPDQVTVEAERMKPIEVKNVRAFVHNHLKKAMEGYFASVEVIAPEEARPESAHVEGRVRVVDVDAVLDSASSGGYVSSRVYGTLNWSFALLVSGHDDFTYSYAGNSTGDFPLSHVSQTAEMYSSSFSAVIADMLAGYVDKEVQKAFLEIERQRNEAQADTEADDSL